MLDEQFSRTGKMLTVDGGNQETAASQISVNAPACDRYRLAVDFSDSRL